MSAKIINNGTIRQEKEERIKSFIVSSRLHWALSLTVDTACG